MATVDAQCSSCGGTGLYQGFAEPKDTAVVCITCEGSGKEIISYKPFTKRKRKRKPGLIYVALSRGSFILTGVGPGESRVTVSEFYKGKMPR